MVLMKMEIDGGGDDNDDDGNGECNSDDDDDDGGGDDDDNDGDKDEDDGDDDYVVDFLPAWRKPHASSPPPRYGLRHSKHLSCHSPGMIILIGGVPSGHLHLSNSHGSNCRSIGSSSELSLSARPSSSGARPWPEDDALGPGPRCGS